MNNFRKPQSRGGETRQRILQAARMLFARDGYDATGVAEICAEAGVTKGAFYYHYPTKQAVFLALLNQWLNILDANLQVVRSISSDIPQSLLAMVDLVPQVFESAAGQVPMFLEFWTQASRDEVVWEATIAPYQRFRDYFTALIQAGIDEGSLKPVDPKAVAQTIVALAVGVLLQGLLDPHGADWSAVMRESLKSYLEGIKQDEEKQT